MSQAPLEIVDMALGMYRRVKQLPQPHPELAIGENQWTCLWDDENQGIRIICEIGGLRKSTLRHKAARAELQMASELRRLKSASLALSSELSATPPNLVTAKSFQEKIEAAEAEIQRLREIIEDANTFETQTREILFPLGEID